MLTADVLQATCQRRPRPPGGCVDAITQRWSMSRGQTPYGAANAEQPAEPEVPAGPEVPASPSGRAAAASRRTPTEPEPIVVEDDDPAAPVLRSAIAFTNSNARRSRQLHQLRSPTPPRARRTAGVFGTEDGVFGSMSPRHLHGRADRAVDRLRGHDLRQWAERQ